MTEGRPPGNRRRRPKKRRRPQNAVPKVIEEPEKHITSVGDEGKTSIAELLNEDKKRSGVFQNSALSRNSLSDPNFQPEQPSEPQNNAAGPQYFRPQPAINRLPVADSDLVGNSRGYIESTQNVPQVDSPAPYVPSAPAASLTHDASYVPILTPIRASSEGGTRLPSENYPNIPNKETTRLSSNSNLAGRGPALADSEDVNRNRGAKPVHNLIPQSNQPSLPVSSHSEVRLPEREQPLLSAQYIPSSYESLADISAPDDKSSEEIKNPASPSNRLPNPSEIHYESTYPDFSEDQIRGTQRIAVRRQETEEPLVGNPPHSYSIPRRDIGTKPQEYDNDAEVDRRQAPQYRPPLQRSGSRYKVDDSDKAVRTREQDRSSTSVPQTRGSSRYQSPATEYVPERTRGLSRSQIEQPANVPYRSRSSSLSQPPSRTRGPQRYAPETAELVAENPRGPSVNSEPLPRNTQTDRYISVEEFNKNEERPPLHPVRTLNQPPTNLRTERVPDEYTSVRNNIRSRPQYEAPESESSHSYEESVEEPNAYNSDYHSPRQIPSRAIPSQRAQPIPNQQPPQPEYQLPSNRYQNRQETQYESPQNPRSRHQPQYQAPQNPRQAVNRQHLPSSSGPQGRARHQSEPPSAPERSSTARSNFRCTDAYGFFPDPVQCDKYYECRNGTSEMHLCSDGLAFNEVSSPKFLRCDSLRDVDCKSRPELRK